MAEQGIIRYGVLGVVAALMAGLVWLGFVRYQAEQRSTDTAVAEAPALPAPAAAPVAAAAPAAAMAPAPPEELVVHVAGAVNSPGLYKLPKGARVADAITAAGGAKPDAVVDAMNLADRLEDGMKFSIPTQKELEAAPPAPVQAAPVKATGSSPAAAKGKVNLNTASAAQLDALPNVTPAVAKNIVEYRSKHGAFKTIEELDKVSGIGPATIEKLRPYLSL
ncbi:MAG TPA: helix-hairpin-helix domain-containing protein [Symbiobacteriaceae bacterium]|nr:helix-hairpin-helix domain-containing protein [Symbiobacteriaceae bacterium]